MQPTCFVQSLTLDLFALQRGKDTGECVMKELLMVVFKFVVTNFTVKLKLQHVLFLICLF